MPCNDYSKVTTYLLYECKRCSFVTTSNVDAANHAWNTKHTIISTEVKRNEHAKSNND